MVIPENRHLDCGRSAMPTGAPLLICRLEWEGEVRRNSKQVGKITKVCSSFLKCKFQMQDLRLRA